jgi:WD40 repeat protein
MSDVFISYSRKDKNFVKSLHAALSVHACNTWVDWSNIPLTADWWQEIEAGIEATNTFVFVLSADAVESKVCHQEIEHAVKHNKRLIPIVRREDFTHEQVHPALRRHNWLFFQEDDDFKVAFQQLLQAIATDLEHVKQHTRLLVRAVEWQHKNYNPDVLLRGSELEDVIQWITQNAEKEPRSTQLQREYVDASRKAERDRQDTEIRRQKTELKRQRVWLGLVTVALLVASGLGILAFSQYRTAEARRKEVEQSQIETLSTSAEAFLNANQGLDGLLYGLRAARKLRDTEGVSLETQMKVTAALQQALHGIRERNRLEGHRDEIWNLAVSPDGKTIASTSQDNTVKLWNLEGQLLATLEKHTLPVSGVSFSPNGKMIATTGEDKTINLWDLKGNLLRSLTGHSSNVIIVNFSLDGKQLVSTSLDGTVKFWSVNGTVLKTLNAHRSGTWGARFSPDGKLLVTCGNDNTVKLWNSSGEFLKTFEGHQNNVRRAIFGPDGQVIASADRDGVIKLWDLSGKEIATIQEHTDAVWGLSFSPDGQILVSASEDGTVRFWNLDGKEVKTLRGFYPAIDALGFSPDGQTLVMGDRGGVVKLWNLNQLTLKHDAAVTSLNFSLDGQTVATGSEDSTVRLWSIDGTKLRTFRGYSSGVSWISFSSDGERINTGTYGGAIKLWDLNGKELRATSEQPLFKIVSFSPDGQTIAFAEKGGMIRLETSNGKQLAFVKGHDAFINIIQFSPDGKTIASPSDDGTVKLWDLQGKHLATLKHGSAVAQVSFSPDGKTIASAGADRTVKLWTLDGKEIRTLRGHSGSVRSVTFSPDGTLIASGATDGMVKLWTIDGQELTTLKGQQTAILVLRFSPDGKTIASASRDGSAILWSLNFDELLTHSCHVLRGYLTNNPNVSESDRQLCNGIERDWVAEGEELARSGDVAGATERFREALRRNSNLNFDPQLKAQQIAAVIPLDQAERLIEREDLEGATQAFKQALNYYPGLNFDPKTKAYQEVARFNVQQGNTLAYQGNLSWAEIQQIMEFYAKAQELDSNVDIPAQGWNSICWNGSLKEYAIKVLDSCEKAVALSPNDAGIRDSRGVARAMTGNYQGAIADFQAFVDSLDAKQTITPQEKEHKERRQRWIRALQAGKNPFTLAELAATLAE